MSGPTSVKVERRETFRFPLTTPSNFYIVDAGGERFLVDSGGERLDPSRVGEVSAVILTHWHWDHSLGITGLDSPIICARKETDRVLSSLETVLDHVYTPLRAMGIEPTGSHGVLAQFFNMVKGMYGEIVESYNSAKRYPIDSCPIDASLEAFPCPGHTDDHQCIIVGDYLFAGDNAVLGESPTTINYRDYMFTVYEIMGREWKRLAPGHGSIIGRREALEYFKGVIERKNKRMARTLAIIPMGVEDFNDLLRRVYGVDPSPQSYVQARTLIGYLRLLEDYGMVVVDREARPWRVEYRSE